MNLDPNDPVDRRIMTLQQKAARQAGREGRDRAAVTRGRPDLEAAYDEGAAEAAADNEDQGDEDQGDEDQGDKAKKSPQPRPGRAAARRGRRGRGKAPKRGLSRGRWQPTLKPPTRVRDAGSLLTGMLLYTAVITYVRYGPDGWKGWLGAKFLNKPMAGSAPSGLKGGSQ